jgi:hypothetical protein
VKPKRVSPREPTSAGSTTSRAKQDGGGEARNCGGEVTQEAASSLLLARRHVAIERGSNASAMDSPVAGSSLLVRLEAWQPVSSPAPNTPSQRLFVRKYSRRAAEGERNSATMEWSPFEHPTIQVGTPCWQPLLARHRRLLLEPLADESTVAFRPRRLLRASQGELRTRGGQLQLDGLTWRRARSWSTTASVRASQGGVGAGSVCPVQRHE